MMSNQKKALPVLFLPCSGFKIFLIQDFELPYFTIKVGLKVECAATIDCDLGMKEFFCAARQEAWQRATYSLNLRELQRSGWCG